MDITSSLTPNSQQVNADDLTHPVTVTIQDVIAGDAEHTASGDHDATGVLQGGGAVINGVAVHTSVTPTPTPSPATYGGGGITQYVETKFKPKKAIRKLIEEAYTEPTVSEAEQEQIILEVAQEIQAIALAEIDANLIQQLIQMYEARLLKQRNDELAAIILLLD